MTDLRVYIALYYNEFGAEIRYCGEGRPSEEEIVADLGDMWEPELGEYIEIYGPIKVQRLGEDNSLTSDTLPWLNTWVHP